MSSLNLPPLTPGPSLENEERAFRTGRGGLVAFGVFGVLLLVAAIAYFFMSGGPNESYELLGRNLTRSKGVHFDGFLMCAFGNTENKANNEEFSAAWHTQSEMGGDRFAVKLREHCLPKLAELQELLEALIPPEELRSDVGALVSATRALRGAVSDFVAAMEADEQLYDRDDAAALVRPIARGWYDYRAAYAAANEHIREFL